MNQQLAISVGSSDEAKDDPFLLSRLNASAETAFLVERAQDAARHFNEVISVALQRGLKLDVDLQRGAVFPVAGDKPLHDTLYLMVTAR